MFLFDYLEAVCLCVPVTKGAQFDWPRTLRSQVSILFLRRMNNEAIIIRTPKKGALNDCNNWRGITLLSIPSKILAKIIINRISNVVDSRLREEQAGFRKERVVSIRFSLSSTSSNSVQNGSENFISTLGILKKHLIAFIDTVFGKP